METASRWDGFGQTVFTEITELARAHDAINLGQGFPDFDGPEFVKVAAAAAIRSGANQYARMFGIPELNRAIAARYEVDTAITVDADTQVTVTSGCTEALAATFLGLVNTGDEVVVIEPFYDSYPACATLAGATARYVTLRPPAFRLDAAALAAAVGPQTRAILINTPHNPTGRVFGADELRLIAAAAIEHDALVFSDEVYERMVYEGAHRSIATLPGMWERTVTLSSLGKSFSVTGWKVGWAVAPEPLTAGIRAAHQFLTFATATPLQHGAAAALGRLAGVLRPTADVVPPQARPACGRARCGRLRRVRAAGDLLHPRRPPAVRLPGRRRFRAPPDDRGRCRSHPTERVLSPARGRRGPDPLRVLQGRRHVAGRRRAARAPAPLTTGSRPSFCRAPAA